MASATQELSDEISDTGPKVCHLLHKHPPGLVSARVVADVCQIFMWSMMMNVRCVIVFRIDVQSLLQHVVHENKKSLLRNRCFVQQGAFLHPPASSSQSVRQLLTQFRQKIVFILAPAPTQRTKLKPGQNPVQIHDSCCHNVVFSPPHNPPCVL